MWLGLVLGGMLDGLAGRELGLFLGVLLGAGGYCAQWLILRGSHPTSPWIERSRHPGPGHESRWCESGLLEVGAGWNPGCGPLRDDLLLSGRNWRELLLGTHSAVGW